MIVADGLVFWFVQPMAPEATVLDGKPTRPRTDTVPGRDLDMDAMELVHNTLKCRLEIGIERHHDPDIGPSRNRRLRNAPQRRVYVHNEVVVIWSPESSQILRAERCEPRVAFSTRTSRELNVDSNTGGRQFCSAQRG